VIIVHAARSISMPFIHDFCNPFDVHVTKGENRTRNKHKAVMHAEPVLCGYVKPALWYVCEQEGGEERNALS